MNFKVISFIKNPNDKNAGPKAPRDINEIISKEYNSKITTIFKNRIYKIKIVTNFFNSRFYNGMIIVQHPIIYSSKVYNLLPKNKTIILIHDISGLRNQDDELLNKELVIFKKFKYIIVHNKKMKKFLIEKGVDEESIYLLNIFDYLADGQIEKINKKFTKTIFYAGNLIKDKSPFIYQLEENKMNFNINLYGIGLGKLANKKLNNMGSFDPDNLSSITGDLGLIWDGVYDDSDSDKLFKNYTKYNNPHKLSCYLASGKPVIAWKKSAIADFIIENNIGYLIDNVYNINKIKFDDYSKKKENAIIIGERLRKGYYTKKVLEDIIDHYKNKKTWR